MPEYVWYAAYGSNLSRERFLCYIQGGKPKHATTSEIQEGMTDPTPPRDSRPIEIPYQLYFAKNSPKWGNGGVAFVDSALSDTTPGRIWLITSGQYAQLRIKEGKCWYDKELLLGYRDGIPVYTITHSFRYSPEVAPFDGYRETMREGLLEIFHNASPAV